MTGNLQKYTFKELKKFDTNEWKYDFASLSLSKWILILNDIEAALEDLLKSSLMNAVLTYIDEAVNLYRHLQPMLKNMALECHCTIVGFYIKSFLLQMEFHKSKKLSEECTKAAISCYTTVLRDFLGFQNSISINNETEYEVLYNIQLMLCQVNKHSAALGLKVIFETRKCISDTLIICRSCNYYKSSAAKGVLLLINTNETFDVFFQQINKSIQSVFHENATQPEDYMEKYLRAASCNIIILRNLVSVFKHDEFPAIEEFFRIWILSKKLPNFITSPQVKEAYIKCIKNELSNVLKRVFKNKTFLQLLENYVRKNSSLHKVVVLVIKDYFETAQFNLNREFVECNIAFYLYIFNYIFDDAASYISSDVYDFFVDMYAMICILDSTYKLKMFLRNNIICGHDSLANPSVKIFCYISQSKLITSAEKLNDFRLWRDLNNIFALFSANPKQTNVQKLLRNYFVICKLDRNISKEEFWDQYGEKDINSNTYRFFLTIGLPTVAYDESYLEIVNLKLCWELYSFLVKWETSCTRDLYYNMIACIKLICMTNVPPQKELIEKLFITLKQILSLPADMINSLCLLIDVIFLLFITFCNSISKEIQQNSLNCISDIMQNRVIYSVPLFKFILLCKDSNCNELIATATNILTKIKIPQNLKNLLESNENINANIYMSEHYINESICGDKCINCGTINIL